MDVSPKPKICHLTTVHDPLDDRIFYRECATLAAAGYQVVIIAPADGALDIDGVRIRALPKAHGRLNRMIGTTWKAYRAALQEQADLYHVHDPELLPIGFLLRMKSKRVIYDAHEDAPDDMMAKAWIPRWLRPPIAWLAHAGMHLTGGLYSGIVAATPRIATRFPASKTALVANYPGSAELLCATVPFAERPNDAVYVGSLNPARGIAHIVRAFMNPAIPESTRLVIAGRFEGVAGSAFEHDVRSSPGWSRVDYRGWQPRDEVLKILRSSKVGLVLLHPQKSFLESLPTKLFEYMAAGMPVVASDFPLWKAIIDGAGCGILVNPLDCDAIAKAIGFLLNNPQEAEAMGRRGRQAVVSHYSWAEQAHNLLKLYGTVLRGKGAMAVGRA